MEKHQEHLRTLRDYYIKNIEEKITDAKLNGPRENRLPGNANFSFPGINGEELLIYLDERGICASSGSACTTGSMDPSHVLVAIGLDKNMSKGALRTSFGEEYTVEDVDFLVDSLVEILNKMRNQT